MARRRFPALDSTALRARAERLARRTESLPRPPFVIAAVAAVALLVAALAGASSVERRAAEVGIFAVSSGIRDVVEVEGLEVEILEYGFGVIELDGQERLTVGAVVRNPNPDALARIVFAATADDGAALVGSFAIYDVPPSSDVLVARTLTDADTGWVEDLLELTVEEVSFKQLEPPSEYLPERFTVVEIEPLLSPQGQRIVYRIESGLDYPTTTRPDVVFRDTDGTIVGGVGGDDQVVDDDKDISPITVMPGTSIRHFNLRLEEIPEGADLLRTEIGPGGIIPGG